MITMSTLLFLIIVHILDLTPNAKINSHYLSLPIVITQCSTWLTADKGGGGLSAVVNINQQLSNTAFNVIKSMNNDVYNANDGILW
jgi:hypothetical protein